MAYPRSGDSYMRAKSWASEKPSQKPTVQMSLTNQPVDANGKEIDTWVSSFPSPSDVKGKGKAIEPDCVVTKTVEGKAKDVVVVDAELGTPAKTDERKRKGRDYELAREWQDHWASRFPWAESVRGEDGRVTQVRCIYCTKIEGRSKLLVPKLDGLVKHAGRRRAVATMKVDGNVINAGEYYILKTASHTKNERLYFSQVGRDTVLDQSRNYSTVERRKKLPQQKLLFYLFSNGISMANYNKARYLFHELHVPDFPTKHWCANSGWELAEAMCEVVKEKTKSVIQSARYISISADEVTTVDTASWLSIHVYTMEKFQRKPSLLSLQKIVENCTAQHITEVIVNDLRKHGGLTDDKLAEKLICFGSDGVSYFRGCNTGVSNRFVKEYAPYMMNIHCVAHRTNLAVDELSKLPLVGKIEDLLTHLNSYFNRSSKRIREFQILAELLDTSGQPMLRNVKQRWLSLYQPVQRVMNECKTLIVKMHQDAPKVPAAAKNLDRLTDLQTMLGMPCILPLLHSLHELMNHAQARDVFVCDYVEAVKWCQAELQEMYVDPNTSFKKAHFQEFCDFLEDETRYISQEWRTDLDTHKEFLSFRIGDNSYPAHVLDAQTTCHQPVDREIFLSCVDQVKGQCRAAAELVISELHRRFPNADLMNALGIVFPQYWQKEDAGDHFSTHLAVIKSHFCDTKSLKIGVQENAVPYRFVTEPLVGSLLDSQQHFFKITMREQCEGALEQPYTLNPLTKLWRTCSASGTVSHKISEYLKLAEIAVVTVIGSVEDERTFSNLNFIKSKVRNRLDEHLDLTVKMFSQGYFGIHNFPYDQAFTEWSKKERLATAL